MIFTTWDDRLEEILSTSFVYRGNRECIVIISDDKKFLVGSRLCRIISKSEKSPALNSFDHSIKIYSPFEEEFTIFLRIISEIVCHTHYIVVYFIEKSKLFANYELVLLIFGEKSRY